MTVGTVYHPKTEGLDALRSLLLEEDRKAVQSVQEVLLDGAVFAKHLEPHLSAKFADLKSSFPQEYEQIIGRMVEQRLEKSQDKVIEALYPVLGKMIKKYIEFQFQLLKESIDSRLEKTKAQLNFWQKIRNAFSGVSEAEVYLSEAKLPEIEELYMVERHSGLIFAHAAKSDNLEPEAVAGMLTAIKAFMEDAFLKVEEELDCIQYANYKILVENYQSYYIAALIKGDMVMRDRLLLLEKLNNFLIKNHKKIGGVADRETLSEQLRSEFLRQ